MKKLKERLAAIDARLDQILQSEDLDDAQRAELKSLKTERITIVASIHERSAEEAEAITRRQESAQLEADAERARLERERQSRIITPPTAGLTTREQPHAGAGGTVAVLDNLAPVAQDPRNRGFRTPRQFLSAVMSFGQRGVMDNLLQPLLAAGSDEARGNSDPTGGILVPEGFSPDFMQIDPEDDPMGAYITRVPMALPILKIPARTDKNHTSSVSGGLTVTRRPETVAGTPSQMTLERVVLSAHELFGLSYVTEELITDSPQSFIAILEKGFSEQFTSQIIKERLTGTGVGEFQGILNSPALITVNKRSGQAAATIVYENILDMVSRCWGFQNAIWLANHDTLPQLGLLNQSVGTGGTAMIWQPSARDGMPDRLMGRPISFSEYPKSLGTAGDLILANWSQYLEGLYQPLESAESMHVRFVNHERAFKFWLRNAGMGWWNVPLTPVVSTNTLSPFVVLQTRS